MDGFKAARIGREDRRAAVGPARYQECSDLGWAEEYEHGYTQEHHALLVEFLLTEMDARRIQPETRGG